jgi:hypothetical protein
VFAIRKDGTKQEPNPGGFMGQRAFSDMGEAELRQMLDAKWPPEGFADWSLDRKFNYWDFSGSMTRSNAASARAELDRRGLP